MSLISYLNGPYSITSLEMNALTLFILCTALIVTSGLPSFLEIIFNDASPCTACKTEFGKHKDDFKKICPNVELLYQGFKVSV
jgi:hypothetical protein